MPRPTKYSTETCNAICAAIAVGCTREQAASVAGISYETLRQWVKSKPAFSAALEKAEAGGVLSRLARIQAAAKEGAWQADAWWLERRYPEQWGRRDRVQVHHDGEVQLRAVVEARTAVLAALVDFPEARLAVAAALKRLDAEQEQQEGDHRGERSA